MFRALLACLSLSVLASSAFAQDAPAPVLVPPVLQEFVEAERPPGTENVEASVELELTIDAMGLVTEARVVTPAGQGLDEAALAAARRFRFTPARRGESTIPSRIRYRYVFEMREVAPPPEPEPEPVERPGRLVGRVVDQDGAPLAGAEVTLSEGAGPLEGPLREDPRFVRRVVADDEGRVVFDDLPPGPYEAHVFYGLCPAARAADCAHTNIPETIEAAIETSVVYRFTPPEEEAEFGASAIVEAPPREVTRRTIGSEELTRIPGTRGDALRAVELLPGVGRPQFGVGQLIVRGSAPGDSQVYFEGMAVPLLYHFGGITSFVNSRMLDRIDFYPGNFSVRYGRKIGGVLEVSARDPHIDRVHAVIDANLLDSSILVEAPIGSHASVAFAARRSYIDFFFDQVVPDDAFDVIAAPVYADYQLFATYRPTSRDRLQAMIYGSSDEFRIVFSGPQDGDPAFGGSVGLSTEFHRVHLGWQHQFSDDVEQELTMSAGPTDLTFAAGSSLAFDASFVQLALRNEWRARLSPAVRVTAGLDINLTPATLTFRGPKPGQSEGDAQIDPISTQEIIDYQYETTAYRPGVYVESDLLPTPDLRLVVGVRLDWYRDVRNWSFDPRLTAIYTLAGHTRLKAGIGMFSQPPEFQESAPGLGNPNLGVIRALHTTVGFEHDFDEAISLGMEGFFKNLENRVVSTPSRLPPLFDNAGYGRIYGLEVSGRFKPRGGFFGFLSYTLSRSERRDRPQDDFRLFDFDQTHILTVAAVYQLGAGWEIGGTFRLVSGNPYTPIVGGIYNANVDLYQPLNGPTNSQRNPFFHRLDVRVEKKFDLGDNRSLALYLDVQNVYNHANQEGLIPNYDFTQETALPGLPILPSLGLRGEL